MEKVPDILVRGRETRIAQAQLFRFRREMSCSPLNLIPGHHLLDSDQFFYRLELRVPGQYPAFMSLGQCRVEIVGVGDGVVGLDCGGFADKGIIRRKNFDRELIQQAQSLLGFVPTYPSLEDNVKN